MDQPINKNITNRCTFMGLPSSGKTSFIGAFWHVVESGEINSTFTVTVPPGDREYLNKLRSNFLDCKVQERTKIDFVKKIEIEVTEQSSGKLATFVFPDLSGETFESQFEYRKLTGDYIEQVSECNSLMLFINPRTLKKSYLISALNGMFEDGEEQEAIVLETATTATRWTPKLCQTQVVLVDLIQIIKNNVHTPCKIGVIISAWDTIKQSLDPDEVNLSPGEWLKKELPLLSQYLFANRESFPSKVFGISAQGGEYSENDNTELQGKLKPSERLIVQDDDVISHDITIPLKWLFDE
ncbi:hypothetical protein [Mucilaginibacter sp. FT3.2]|uniref:TRAFAC clade GTPase domain-containing protein n=1 Tax=Mucilaginibacter sp. FT3.2 TaxID=2723090 RepID=UPI0016078F54|nr:GTPase SAR1 family protein [Mucilaginibacter sp. FT3.2]